MPYSTKTIVASLAPIFLFQKSVGTLALESVAKSILSISPLTEMASDGTLRFENLEAEPELQLTRRICSLILVRTVMINSLYYSRNENRWSTRELLRFLWGQCGSLVFLGTIMARDFHSPNISIASSSSVPSGTGGGLG